MIKHKTYFSFTALLMSEKEILHNFIIYLPSLNWLHINWSLNIIIISVERYTRNLICFLSYLD